MPLHTEHEGSIVGLDALDQAIGGGRDRRESWGQARDALMVHAVHRECLGLEQAGQPRARGDPHVMRALVAAAAADREVVVLDRRRVLGADVLVETAAHGHVEELGAATYRQYRFALGERPPHEQQLGPVARRVGPLAVRAARLAVRARVHVHAAGQEQTVDPLVDPAECGLIALEERNDPRDRTDGHEHLDVALAHHPAARQLVRDRLERLRRDADDRPVVHAATLTMLRCRYKPSAVSTINWSTTALRSPVRS